MSTWNDKLLNLSPEQPLPHQIAALLEKQRTTWPLFRNGEAACSSIVTKRLYMDNRHVIVQSNPGRSVSTNAKVDPASIAKRPCFLCPASLPPEERGIAFGNYVILPNPFPILRHHVTIAYHEHTPQALEQHIGDYIALVKALGPDMFALYNGPRCGASAPDHLHFQACSSESVPLFEQLPTVATDHNIVPMNIWGRNLLACSFIDAIDATKTILSIIATLKTLTAGHDEPMLNIVALFSLGRFAVALFPRAKHRSACYFAEPAERLSISPAAVEMAGIVVVADSSHFERVNESAVYAMYREVTLGDDLFSRLVEAIT